MENYILIFIVLMLISYFGYKTWKVYQPKKTLICIEPEELKNKLKQNHTIQMIDVRTKGEFSDLHIPDAINIPLENLKKELKQFSKDTKIVIVCMKGAERSHEGAIIAAKMGYDATWLCGGTNVWFNENKECMFC